MSRILAILFLFTLLSAQLYSQNFEINNETVTTCGGSFLDDNGGSGAVAGTSGEDYTNTDYTYTICSDNPGDVISVNFALFNLYQSANANNSDYLAVFDGDNTGENTLGSYTGNAAQGLSITGTVNNTSGCLTFVFNPSNTSPGGFAGWEAIISCTTPCANPTSISTIADPIPDLDNSVSVCLNQPISFENAGSFSEPGFTLENYIWNFDDGTIITGEQNAEHVFSEPGEYIVTLTVEDNNGCQNLNLVPLQVLVSTIPIFNTDFSAEICLGAEGYVNGNPVQSETWTALPPQVVAGETYLPDDAGASYTSELVFDFFEDGQTLDDCNDLLEITVNMEHSYMGDLQIQINCPSGNTVTLVEFGDGGGGTFLGEALDDGTLDPGVGYDYSWDPTATNGNWADNSNGVNVLPTGTYQSSYDMCDLVGCELNGEWTIEVIDNLLADNGYIFEWGINFNPEIMPGITTFTPEIGLGLDSTWIEGNFLSNVTPDGNFANVTPTSIGEHEYTFFASNNFGCTFDTTLIVEVFPQPEIILPGSITGDICTEFNITPEIIMDLYSTDIQFELVLENTLGNGFGNASVQVFVNGALIEDFDSTADLESFSFDAESGDEITLEYTESTWGDDGNQVSLLDSFGNAVYQSEVNPISGQLYESVTYNGIEFEWTPTIGLNDPDALVLSGDFLNTTTYELSVFPTGFPVCTVTEEIQIITEDAPDPGLSAQIEICDNEFEELILIDLLGGTPDPGGIWLDANNNIVSGTITEPEDAGVLTYLLSIGTCNYESELDLIINSLELEALNDTTICENGVATLNAVPLNNIYPNVNYVWNNGLFSTQNINVQPILNQTLYEVYAEYSNGCLTEPVSSVITTLAPLQMTSILDQTICLGDSLVTLAINPEGGLEPYNFSWNSNLLSSNEDTVTLMPSVTTEYTLEYSDACESTPITDNFIINLNPIIPATFNSSGIAGCYPVSPQFFGQADDLSLISSVVWGFGDGGTSNSINAASHTYNEPGDYDVSLTITGIDGCIYEHTEENLVEAYDVPTAGFSPVENTVVIPNSEFEFINYSIGAEESQWTFDEYGTSAETNPDFTFPLDMPTDLEIELVSINSDECSDTARYTVFLVDGFALYAPNAFTPDNDGINDVWKIEGVDIDPLDYEVFVFNRIGNVVFHSTDPLFAWNGSFGNGEYYVPVGVYSYIIKTRAKTNGDKKKITGQISILR